MADQFFSQILTSCFLIISFGTCGVKEKCVQRFLMGNPEGKWRLGRNRLRWVDNIKTKKWDGKARTGFMWLRMGTNGRLLCMNLQVS